MFKQTLSSIFRSKIFGIKQLEFSPDLRITNLFFKKDFLLNNTINSAFIDKLYIYKSDSCGNVRLEKENKETILTFFMLIEQKFSGDHPYKREMIKSFIVALLYEIEPIFKTKILEFHYHQKITRKEEIMKGDKIFSFANAKQAYEAATSRDLFGKVVIEIGH